MNKNKIPDCLVAALLAAPWVEAFTTIVQFEKVEEDTYLIWMKIPLRGRIFLLYDNDDKFDNVIVYPWARGTNTFVAGLGPGEKCKVKILCSKFAPKGTFSNWQWVIQDASKCYYSSKLALTTLGHREREDVK